MNQRRSEERLSFPGREDSDSQLMVKALCEIGRSLDRNSAGHTRQRFSPRSREYASRAP